VKVFLAYWLAVLRITWEWLKSFWLPIVIGYGCLPIADLLIYYTFGRKSASDWVWSSAMTQVFPLTIIGLTLTLVFVFIISPFLFHGKTLREFAAQLDGVKTELAATKSELMTGRGQIEELTRKALSPTFREGDNRYLLVRELGNEGHVIGREYVGRFSIGVAPDRAQTVESVNVEMKDILGCGTDFRNVKLRFDGQVQTGPVDINPGETKFITLVGFSDRGRSDDQIVIYHAGQDGFGRVVSGVPKAERYTAKIYITGRNTQLHPFHIAFGIHRGEFYLSQVDG
jgi:hypothetical protein